MAKEDMLLHQTGSHPWWDSAAQMEMSDALGDAPGFPANIQLLLQKRLLQVLCHISQLCVSNSDTRAVNTQVRSLRATGMWHYQSQ